MAAQCAAVVRKSAGPVEDFGCERHDLAVAVEQALDRVEAEGTKLIGLPCRLAHMLIPDSIGFAARSGILSKRRFRNRSAMGIYDEA